MSKSRQNMWFSLATNSAIDLGFVFGALIPYLCVLVGLREVPSLTEGLRVHGLRSRLEDEFRCWDHLAFAPLFRPIWD